jgi:hypothetical protein
MAARSLRRASLCGPKQARRAWLKREIAKTDRQLKLLEDHILAQRARIDELERTPADTATARAFLVTLQECREAHETYYVRLARDLAT